MCSQLGAGQLCVSAGAPRGPGTNPSTNPSSFIPGQPGLSVPGPAQCVLCSCSPAALQPISQLSMGGMPGSINSLCSSAKGGRGWILFPPQCSFIHSFIQLLPASAHLCCLVISSLHPDNLEKCFLKIAPLPGFSGIILCSSKSLP